MDPRAPHPPPEVMPPGVLGAIGALLLVTLVAAAAVRLSGVDIREPDAQTVATRLLRFDDSADGSVVVVDATSGRTAARISGEQGFLRGTMRAMARERRRAGGTPDQPFELMARADGRLTLLDPVTHQRIDLESFGPSNSAVFARLLADPAPRQP